MSEMSEHEKLVAEKLKAMDRAEEYQTEAVRNDMLEFLLHHKGYSQEDIEQDRQFKVGLSGCEEYVSTDFIVKVGGRRFIAIKCAAGSVDSRERHITAFSRVVDEYQIPYCLVTDGENTRVIDTFTGKVVSENIHSLQSKQEALEQIDTIKFLPYPSERVEKEKRILLAFETVRCPNTKS